MMGQLGTKACAGHRVPLITISRGIETEREFVRQWLAIRAFYCNQPRLA